MRDSRSRRNRFLFGYVAMLCLSTSSPPPFRRLFYSFVQLADPLGGGFTSIIDGDAGAVPRGGRIACSETMTRVSSRFGEVRVHFP